MVGNFNSRNTNWVCNHTDSKGKIIELILKNNNITDLNNGTFTPYNSVSRAFSAINLFFFLSLNLTISIMGSHNQLL